MAIITGTVLIDVKRAAPAPRPPVPIEVVHGDQRRLQLVLRLVGRCRADLAPTCIGRARDKREGEGEGEGVGGMHCGSCTSILLVPAMVWAFRGY